ncbi:hypothetical protein M3221_17485 [Domibacillus indicus]|uniref:hypothetical protein n=1 Tax=Domibacillus indicus TaxID=1437523 RepID=UPI00203D8F64|nr:hypothetical protein [Domibacillus indicus]MCM3790177.1 hypothetical protein [Domibacillus indicus]
MSRNLEKANQLVEEIEESGREAKAFQADVISREALEQAAAILKHGKELALLCIA